MIHLHLTIPHLFGGPLRHYWPVIVMLVAFAGVALGEALRRRGRLVVLGRPLAGTGVLLPVLPVVAFWFAASRVHYSALLALAGLLYGLVAVVRGSLRFGLVAALAGNAAVWYLLHQHESLALLVHPQLWVIPAALSVLAAGEMNRAGSRPTSSAASATQAWRRCTSPPPPTSSSPASATRRGCRWCSPGCRSSA